MSPVRAASTSTALLLSGCAYIGDEEAARQLAQLNANHAPDTVVGADPTWQVEHHPPTWGHTFDPAPGGLAFPEPPEPGFIEHFDTTDALARISPRGMYGQWRVEDGLLSFVADDVEARTDETDPVRVGEYALVEDLWGDFDLEARVRINAPVQTWDSGEPTDTPHDIVVLFGFVDDYQYYLAQFPQSYYDVQWLSSGFYLVHPDVNGGSVVPLDNDLGALDDSFCAKSPVPGPDTVIDDDGWHTIQISVIDDTFTMVLDGAEVARCYGVDPNMMQGRVGLGTLGRGDAAVDFDVDHIAVAPL